ncbi:MAG: tetratricopeptide repeat protein [Bacteroidota bacterium]|nr:tetratricopeptide repeat protein [Bacteroidota bacterium]
MMLKKAFLLCFIFYLSALVQVHAQYENLLNKTFVERYYLLIHLRTEVMKDWPNSGHAKLEAMIKWAEKDGEKEIALELKLCKIICIGAEKKESGKLLIALIEESKANNLNYHYAQATHLMAVYQSEKNINLAYSLFFESYNIYSKQSSIEFPYKLEYTFRLASFLMVFEDYDNAKKYLREATLIQDNPDIGLLISTTNSLAMCFRNINQYDSALYYFEKAMDIAEKKNDTLWSGILGGNMGITYFLQGKYAEAKPLIENDIKTSMRKNVWKNAAHSIITLAELYRLTHKLDSSFLLARQARLIYMNKGFTDYKLLRKIYNTLSTIYAAKGDGMLAWRYSDSASVARDSVQKKYNNAILSTAKMKLQNEAHQNEVNQLNSEKKLNTYIRNSLLAGILFLVIIAILILNRQKLKHIQKEKLLNAVSEAAKKELQLSTIQLEEFTANIHQKNEMIERFEVELSKTNEPVYDSKALSEIRHAIILTDEQWDHFTQLFEKVHGDFLYRLKTKLPDLSPAETRFMALSKLQLSNKEMAAMLGISSDAVRMSRHRLRKKLSLEEEGGLEDLLESI